tara:strand:- start:2074 stop:2517 length:444 start_codon:yes stop_codon:yes gene_type:complete
MGFFKKLGRSTGRLFKKASHGVSHTFKKAGKGITRGVSSLAGGMSGSAIGGSIAGLLGPEAIPLGMAIGGIAGRELGKEGGGIAYDALSKQRRNKVNSLVNQVTRQSIPDSKYFRGPVRVGQNGGGIRQKNPLEKSKVKRNEMGNIV